jgi:hypothetical protein
VNGLRFELQNLQKVETATRPFVQRNPAVRVPRVEVAVCLKELDDCALRDSRDRTLLDLEIDQKADMAVRAAQNRDK